MRQSLKSVKKVPKSTSFRLQVFSRHPSHNCIRAAKLMFPFRCLIRFGSSTVGNSKYAVDLNPVDAVHISANKLLMKEKFAEADVPTAMWWRGTQETVNLLLSNSAADYYPIVAKSLYGSRCKGNTLIQNVGELNTWLVNRNLSNYIFEKYYAYNREYRLHVWKGGCFYTCRKMLKSDTEAGKRWFRNDSNSSWIIEENPSFDKPTNWDKIIESCVKGLNAVGLDVAAFDVRVQSSHDGKGNQRPEPAYIILESNSAPSMGKITEQKYIEQLPIIISQKYEQTK